MRKAYFKQLLGLTLEMQESLLYENVEQYAVLLEQRQHILDKIDAYNNENGKDFSDEERQLIEKIYRLDQKNNIEFNAQLEYAKEEVRKANILSRREEYYANLYSTAMEGGIFFDKK